MTGTINLREFTRQGSRIRLDAEYITSSIDMSELTYITKMDRFETPLRFDVKGKEKTVTVELSDFEINRENEIEMWVYKSREAVMTKSGPRRVSITVFND